MLTLADLDDGTLEAAAHLVAREHTAAVASVPGLPAAYTDPNHCAAALSGLLADGYRGVVARADGACTGVLCGRARDGWALLSSTGVAVDPRLADPTATIVRLFAELAPPLVEQGALRHIIGHVALTPLSDALYNLGFGRGSVFGSQPARPVDPDPDVDVRIGSPADLDAIAALSYIELKHRESPPVYTPPLPNTLGDTRARHQRLLEAGAVHFLASVGGDDVGLLTLEMTSPVPRLCPDGQPYIGPTATEPSFRGRGIGHAVVHAALDWSHRNGFHTVSVDFDSPNPLSRPFWTGLGFGITGFGVQRSLDPSFAGGTVASA